MTFLGVLCIHIILRRKEEDVADKKMSVTFFENLKIVQNIKHICTNFMQLFLNKNNFQNLKLSTFEAKHLTF